MSIFQDAHVMVLIADYIGLDASGKVNALGAGFSLAGVAPTGLTAPQYVLALVDVPAKYNGQQFALALELRDETTGKPVMLPTAPDGQLQPLRVQQAVMVQLPLVPGLHLPAESVKARVQMPLAFGDGLPLTPGHAYAWKVEIDGQSQKAWSAYFFVPGPPPPVVFGGLAGPADIPNVLIPEPPADDDQG